MGEMKHTPGPWSCLADPHKEAGQPDLPRWSVRSGKTPILDGYFLREDDALLTAAAPDLRAVAEAVVAADQSDLGVIDLLLELKRISRSARAALSKAEGRSLSSASGQEGGE